MFRSGKWPAEQCPAPDVAGSRHGVWASAYRRKARILDKEQDKERDTRPWKHVPPPGQPLVQRGHRADGGETIAEPTPAADRRFAMYLDGPELGPTTPWCSARRVPALVGL